MPDINYAGQRPEEATAPNQDSTHLFLLRLWLEEFPHAASENDSLHNEEALRWHGKVQHLTRGEARAFTGWDMMIGHIEAMLSHN